MNRLTLAVAMLLGWGVGYLWPHEPDFGREYATCLTQIHQARQVVHTLEARVKERESEIDVCDSFVTDREMRLDRCERLLRRCITFGKEE
jgi:hypothetical protein